MPRMPSRTRASSRLLACAAASVVAGAAALGCDAADSDYATREKLNEAYAHRLAGNGDRPYVALADTAAASQSSPATLAQANELVGDVSVEMAGVAISGENRLPEPGLGALMTRAVVLAERANRLADALALGRAFIDVERQRDPAPLLQGTQREMEGIQSGEAWQPGGLEGMEMPTLEQVEQRIEQLSARLEELTAQIQQLDQQRTQLLTQASQLDQQSDQEQGQQSVQTFRQVTDLRTEAANVAASAEKLEAEARQTGADLQEATTLRDSLQQAVAALQTQQQTMQTRWTDVQTQIQQIQQTGQETYSGGGEVASVESLGQELSETLQQVDTLRSEAVRLLEKASSAYSTAASSAREAAVAGSPMFDSAYSEAFSSSRINLSRAVALRQLGMLHANSAAIYSSIMRLQQTLEEGGQQLPSSVQEALGASPQEAYRTAVEAASAALVEADQMLTDLAGGSGPLGSSAITQRAVSLTTILSLRDLMQATGIEVEVELPTEQQIREQAGLVADAARSTGATLPAARPFTDIATRGVAPQTQPGEEPATEPATQPEEVPEGEAGEDGMPDDAGDDGAGGDPAGDPAGGDPENDDAQ